jgi:hypothetical protein
VTSIVTGLVTNNELSCVANSTTLGGDPACGIVKNLQINFRFGGTNRIVTFPENSNVSLGGNGQNLTNTRALYGDPRLFSDAAVSALSASNALLTQLRRIELPPNVVAFCGGRRMRGAALTSEGEVWVWGEAMGRHTPPIPPLPFCSRLLNQIGIGVRWGDPSPLILKQPSRLENSDGE